MANLGSFHFFNPSIKIASPSTCHAVMFLLSMHPLRHAAFFERERGGYRNLTNMARNQENNPVCPFCSALPNRERCPLHHTLRSVRWECCSETEMGREGQSEERQPSRASGRRFICSISLTAWGR